MKCLIALTLVTGLADTAPGEKSLIELGPNMLIIPIHPKPGAPNARARTAIMINRGGSFYVAESRDEVAFAPCYEPPKRGAG